MYAVPKELGAYDEGDKGVGPYTIKITDVLPNGVQEPADLRHFSPERHGV